MPGPFGLAKAVKIVWNSKVCAALLTILLWWIASLVSSHLRLVLFDKKLVSGAC